MLTNKLEKQSLSLENATRIANFKTFDELMEMSSIKKLFKFISLENFKKYNNGNFIPHYIVNGRKAFSAPEVSKWIGQNLVEKNKGHKLVTKFISYPQSNNVIKNIPSELIGISGELKEIGSPPPCVYFLVDVDEIVYVGKSVNIYNRISGHQSEGEKIYTRVLYIPVYEGDLDKVERGFIDSLDPKYNVDGYTMKQRRDLNEGYTIMKQQRKQWWDLKYVKKDN